MASSTSSVANQSFIKGAKVPLWLWPNLLSLDAPIIAALWQNLFAQDAHVTLSLASRAALPLCVWFIYLVDRLLDTSNAELSQATARHTFYVQHRMACYLLTIFSAAGCAVSVAYLPLPVFKNGLAVLSIVVAYFLAIHRLQCGMRRRLPKEFIVGIVFSIGAVLAPLTWSSHPWKLVFPALLFGVLCWTNSAAIEIWEVGCVDAASRLMVRHVDKLALAICLLCLLQTVFIHMERSSMAIVVGSLGSWAVVRMQPGFKADLRRVSIDLPLLAPMLLFAMQ